MSTSTGASRAATETADARTARINDSIVKGMSVAGERPVDVRTNSAFGSESNEKAIRDENDSMVKGMSMAGTAPVDVTNMSEIHCIKSINFLKPSKKKI